MDIADRDNLLRDMRMYAASLLRVLQAPLHPFDWRRTTAELRETIAAYQTAVGTAFNFITASLSMHWTTRSGASTARLRRLIRRRGNQAIQRGATPVSTFADPREFQRYSQFLS